MVAPAAGAEARSTVRSVNPMPRVTRATLLLPRGVRRGGRRFSAGRDAFELRRTVRLALGDYGREERVAEVDDLRAIGPDDGREHARGPGLEDLRLAQPLALLARR